VTKTANVDESSLLDIVEMINVEKIWQACLSKYKAKQDVLDKSASEKVRVSREAAAVALEKSVTDIAGTFIGKIGRTLAEKEIASRGGRDALLDPVGAEGFLAAVEKSAKLLTSTSRTKDLLDALKAEISGRRPLRRGEQRREP
ncbi:MAG TPA: GTPase-activating protein, partial [Thermoanaerobaculia bacterium]